MNKTYVQFLWHFHQPYYGLPDQSSNQLPWVRLHATKSYYDMGRMLEEHPQIHCVVNFSGSLLQQLREYVDEGKRDTWWELTRIPAAHLGEGQRYRLLRDFFALDWERHVEPMPRYRQLLEKRGDDMAHCDPSRFEVQELRDLQVLFNLAWFGFSARQERAVVGALIEKGRGFTESEKRAVLEQQIEVMQLITPLYRKLHHRGQIELSITPMHHPILPLLLDTDSAGVSAPDSPLPPRLAAPRDAHFHLTEARTLAREVLGADPAGMWPAEGGVSAEAVDLFGVHDLDWIATDEKILERSLQGDWQRHWDLYHPWHLEGRLFPQIFFRDADLSDRIGFSYAAREAEEAATDFVDRVRDIGAQRPAEGAPPVVSVILDGENPWMHYPNDGEDFLAALYGAIEAEDAIETTTPSRFLEEHGPGPPVADLHAGSWIDADFSIWIGGEETNRAWRFLGQTRRDLSERTDAGEHEGIVERELYDAWQALYVAEASDWFWWYGDDFVSHNDADFDRLFRDQLRFVYDALGEEVPAELEVPIGGSGAVHLEFQPPHSLIQPTIDGDNAFFYEWSGAGVYRCKQEPGPNAKDSGLLREIRIGFDLGFLYMMLDPTDDFDAEDTDIRLGVEIIGPDESAHRITVRPTDRPDVEVSPAIASGEDPVRAAFQNCLELAVPFEWLDLTSRDRFSVRAFVWRDDVELERHPPDGALELEVPDETFEMRHWMV